LASYAFWNNKGGVGKSFLGFIASTEYAHQNPDADVYVIDLCPQGNISETLLGGFDIEAKAINELISTSPRRTVAGYLEMRLSSPFKVLDNVEQFVCQPKQYNKKIPPNVWLVCGDNLLEILSEAIRQTSQLAVPFDAWKQVISWIDDLTSALRKRSEGKDCLFVNCSSIYSGR
jgi:cellulose biosynthesis protein BcsQ